MSDSQNRRYFIDGEQITEQEYLKIKAKSDKLTAKDQADAKKKEITDANK